MTVSYTNTLSTSIQNATVDVTISGSAVDYNSIKTTSGFYRSTDHTIVFSRDTDPSLATLAPGASGIGVFTFSTLAPGTSPSVADHNILRSPCPARALGTDEVPEQVNSSTTETAKVATTVLLSASSLHASGPFSNSGPIPPHGWPSDDVYDRLERARRGKRSRRRHGHPRFCRAMFRTPVVCDAADFSYDSGSRTVSWNIGDLAQGASAQGAFQVSLTPSTSQKGSAPALDRAATFSGYDRFAGVQISATANPVTTETTGDPGYVGANAIVQ